MISFACSQCGRALRAPDEQAGKKARCPQCGGVTPIPGFASASKGDVTSPDSLKWPSRQNSAPGPTTAPVLVEPIDPAEVPPAATQATSPPDDTTPSPAAVEVRPRGGPGRLAGWAREHKRTVLGVGGGLLALCLVLLVVLPRPGSDGEPERRRSEDGDSQLSKEPQGAVVGTVKKEPRGTVFGTVKYDGKTVPIGYISFQPEKGTGIVVAIQDGKYRADAVPPGPVAVTVSTAPMRAVYKAVERLRKSGQPPPGVAPAMGTGGGQAPGMKDKLKAAGGPKEMPAAAELAQKLDEAWNNIKDMIDVPEKYADPEKSGLKFEIKSDPQEISIDLPKVEGFKPKTN